MRERIPRGALLAILAGALAGFVVVVLALGVRDARTDDRFDLVRWQLDTVANRWLAILDRPFSDEPDADALLREYFSFPLGDERRRPLENAVERVIEGRIDRVLQDAGLSARVRLPGTTFPPVDIELALSPRVLVTSPRRLVERDRVELLRADIAEDRALAIEAGAEDTEYASIVVPSGGVATYPAIVADRERYASVVAVAAHEWVHHYLAFYPLGIRYFTSADMRTLNETVADIIGDEVAATVLDRWGDPTLTRQPAPASPAAVDRSEVLRLLRLEVDELLAAGRVVDAEHRMEEVRAELEVAGVTIRRLNQAYFAWYGTYAARPDAVDPVGGYLREIRSRSPSLADFVQRIRVMDSRADVQRVLVELGGTP